MERHLTFSNHITSLGFSLFEALNSDIDLNSVGISWLSFEHVYTCKCTLESFTSNCKTQLMERDAFLPCGALFVLYFELGAWYCNAPLYSLSRHLSIVLSQYVAIPSGYWLFRPFYMVKSSKYPIHVSFIMMQGLVHT